MMDDWDFEKIIAFAFPLSRSVDGCDENYH